MTSVGQCIGPNNFDQSCSSSHRPFSLIHARQTGAVCNIGGKLTTTYMKKNCADDSISSQVRNDPSRASSAAAPDRLVPLRELERKVLWLTTWTIHHAIHVRESRDGLKVGGHQASCASAATLMTALYFETLGPEAIV